ncbi:MAG: serine/threonine protein kinase [Acidobacteria bacterium]|nr:serine/threonine protein kinase [Acidobacteriota bacterium]
MAKGTGSDGGGARDAEAKLLDGTPYRVLGELASGGHGVVFEVEHRDLGSRAVAKVLRVGLAKHPQLVDRLRLEAQALARLEHPNLVAVRDFGKTADGRPFLVMEKLRGGTLRAELAARGPLPIAEAVGIVRQALAGLGVAHAAGLVHRDIKLDNLFLCEPPPHEPTGRRVLKVLDFGVAKVLDAHEASAPKPLAIPTEEGVLVGTPRYLAPEQIKEEAVDARTDLYAMGLVLYALLTGTGPYEGADDWVDLIRAHVFTPARPPSFLRPQIPTGLEGVILRALEKEPSARFQSAADMAAALAPFECAAPDLPTAQERPMPDAATERLPDDDARTSDALQGPPALPPLQPLPPPAPAEDLTRLVVTVAGRASRSVVAEPTLQSGGVAAIARSAAERPAGRHSGTSHAPMRPAMLLGLSILAFALVGGAVAGIILGLR